MCSSTGSHEDRGRSAGAGGQGCAMAVQDRVEVIGGGRRGWGAMASAGSVFALAFVVGLGLCAMAAGGEWHEGRGVLP